MTTARFEEVLVALALLTLSGGYLAMWWAWPIGMAWGHGSLVVFSLVLIAWRMSSEWMPRKAHKGHGIRQDQGCHRVEPRRTARVA